jgi:metal-responsive CopG/Arc/MetJ family transcriptional regulator
MSTQIAVRLPEDLVEHVDQLVHQGGGSRAAVVTRALRLYLMQLRGEEDARIYEATGDYDELDGMFAHQSFGD